MPVALHARRTRDSGGEGGLPPSAPARHPRARQAELAHFWEAESTSRAELEQTIEQEARTEQRYEQACDGLAREDMRVEDLRRDLNQLRSEEERWKRHATNAQAREAEHAAGANVCAELVARHLQAAIREVEDAANE